MYIDSRIDNNIILMTVNSLKIVCNARFLEIYVNTNINANTADTNGQGFRLASSIALVKIDLS